MADDPIPAIAEAEATGETAAIFADIRAAYGVGAVNLIWRHLATIPDALPWAWEAIRPLYVDGTIAREAAAFRSGLQPPALPPVPPEIWAALGLSRDDLTRIRGVLAAYDRTNSMALIALSALSADAGRAPRTVLAALHGDRENFVELPALTPLNAMPPHVAALVTRLNGLGATGEKPILASMYRHLSHWPPYLALAWAALVSVDASGALDAAIAATSDQAKSVAASVPMAAGSPPPGAREAITPFIGNVLPKMVAICGMLRAMDTGLDA